MDELWRKGAGDLAALISKKEVSARDVVEAHLGRIDAVNGSLNAITLVLADSAREAAKEADRRLARGEAIGPLHGVPVTVKQNIDLVGSSTNWGVPALAGAIPPIDSPVVERMKAAGAIPIGRTNCPDMALRVHTDSGLYGLTRNPWNPSVTTGGSSGGEAAALASGMSPIGLGNDIGGSLRNPATCCGIASIKPSAGLVPLCTLVPDPNGPASFQLMPVEGPMARRVSDVRLGLEVLAGRHRRDPYSVPVVLDGISSSKRGRRVSVLADPPGGSTDPRVADRVRAAASALTRAGWEVVDSVPPRYEEVVQVWAAFLITDIRTMLPQMGALMSETANRFLQSAMDVVPPLDLAGYTKVLMDREALMRDWAMWFEDVDIVLTPTWTQLPFAHGWDVEHAAETLDMMRCVTHANVLGLPAACAPAGLVEGIPVGVMLTADRFGDLVALEAAEIIEAELAPSTPIDPITA